MLWLGRSSGFAVSGFLGFAMVAPKSLMYLWGKRGQRHCTNPKETRKKKPGEAVAVLLEEIGDVAQEEEDPVVQEAADFVVADGIGEGLSNSLLE